MKPNTLMKSTMSPATGLLIGVALSGVATSACAQTVTPPPASNAASATPAKAPASSDLGIIKSVDVTGSQRIEPDTVRSYIQLRPGQTYSKVSLDQAIRDLFQTELFEDAQIRDNNGALTIEVRENPVINRVLFEGNKRLKEDKLNPEIKLAPRQIFTPSKVRADVARIIELYKRQGRYAASVEPKKVPLDQNRVDVVYEINEGPKSKVRQINIIGNHVFGDEKLRAQMATKTSRLSHLLSSSTSYDPDRLAYDQSKLRQFYLTQGYADFRIVSAVAELTPDKRDFVITYVIEEGERYKFGDVTVESDIRDLKPVTFNNLLRMKKGDYFNSTLVENTTDDMTKQAGVFGYAFAEVNPNYHRNADTRTMDITFKVEESPRVYVERINVNGNTLTQDKVVRREFRLAEGDAFNSFQVKRTEDRIKSLGYFQEKFEIDRKKGSSDDRIVLTANVEEKATGELQLSAGYSSLEKLIFSASIAQRNFRGAGQTLRLSASVSTYSKSVELGFTEPYLFNKNIALGVDIFRRDYTSFNYVGTSRNDSYRSSQTGFQVRAGLPLTEYWSMALRYGFNVEDITLDQNTYYIGGQCSVLLAGRYLCDAIGHRITSSAGVSIVRDTRDNRLHPRNGTYFILGGDFAGLGGSVKYARATASFARYKDLGRGFISSLSLEAGAIAPLTSNATTDPVRLTDRFFLGEPQFAGFDIRGVGPRVQRIYDVSLNPNVADSNTGNYVYDALGGRYYYKGRVELEIPLGSGAKELGLRPSIFADIGAVWGVRTPALITEDSLDPKGNPYFYALDTSGNKVYASYTSPQQTLNIGGVQVLEYLNADSGTQVITTCTTGYTIGNQPADGKSGCTGTTSNAGSPYVRTVVPFHETFFGNTPRPRLSIGFGVNWNSPFGPFRIDVAKALLKSEGDQTKLFTFNVGTQF